MKHLRLRACVAVATLVGCLATAGQAEAQAGTGTLSGTVVDEQGAAVPGAIVTVTEQATGAVRTTVSDAEGAFRLPSLPAGRYTVDITLDGFAPLKVTDVPLAPAEVRSLERLQLKLGQLAESVTVTADTAVVQTATSSRMATVTAEQLTNIPMKGRDLFGLLTVVPGVQDTVRLQLQMYNIFNLVQYTNLDTTLNFQDDPSVPGVDNLLLTSTTHGRYTTTTNNIGTTPPRQIGVTLRLDF